MSSLDDLLRAVPFFATMSPTELAQLEHMGSIVACGAGAAVFRENDEADRLYVILEGEVRVVRCDRRPDGTAVETQLAVLGRGDYFGEMALLSDGRRTASVICQAPSRFFALERDRFFALAAQSSQLITHLIRSLTSKIHGTNEKFLEQLLEKEQLQAQAEIRRHRAIADMVVGVAHELNTPLGIINNAASVIERRLMGLGQGGQGANRTEHVEDLLGDLIGAVHLVQKNVARAHQLLQRFRSISVTQLADTRQRIHLVALVDEVAQLRRLQSPDSRLDLRITCRLHDEDAYWVGYPRYLSQVLDCLLSNVERHAYDGAGGAVEIEMAEVPVTGLPRFAIAVRDRGRGIAASHLPRVFDPFFTTARAQGALGLGLSIARNIVTSLLAGQIRAQSAPGEGTTITVELPRILEETSSDELVEELASEETSTASPSR
ncbi:MAG TPA: ATP-binding protein [Polyangia bacterium]|jgi:signal transduction histidine kinase|nr:ATP-binding protein [Polyangia bacterium]